MLLGSLQRNFVFGINEDVLCTVESVLEDNAGFLERANKQGAEYILIDSEYEIPL